MNWEHIETAPKGKKILIAYKNELNKWRIVIGKFIKRYTLESSCDYYELDEYHEKSGNYYTREGWYEYIDNWDEFCLIPITEGEPKIWAHLPEIKK